MKAKKEAVLISLLISVVSFGIYIVISIYGTYILQQELIVELKGILSGIFTGAVVSFVLYIQEYKIVKEEKLNELKGEIEQFRKKIHSISRLNIKEPLEIIYKYFEDSEKVAKYTEEHNIENNEDNREYIVKLILETEGGKELYGYVDRNKRYMYVEEYGDIEGYEGIEGYDNIYTEDVVEHIIKEIYERMKDTLEKYNELTENNFDIIDKMKDIEKEIYLITGNICKDKYIKPIINYMEIINFDIVKILLKTKFKGVNNYNVLKCITALENYIYKNKDYNIITYTLKNMEDEISRRLQGIKLEKCNKEDFIWYIRGKCVIENKFNKELSDEQLSAMRDFINLEIITDGDKNSKLKDEIEKKYN